MTDEPNTPARRPPDDPRLAAEQVRLLYSYARSGVSSNIVNALLVCVVLWSDGGGNTGLLLWFVCMTSLSLGRYAVLRAYFRAPTPDADYQRWLFRFAVGAVLSASLWGVTGSFMLPPHDAASRVLIVFVLGGMTAGGVSNLSPVYRVFVPYALLILVPLGITLLIEGNVASLAMAAMVVVYIAMLLASGWRAYNVARESLALRFQNQSLVQNLERINADLTAEIEERERVESALVREESRALVTLESIGDGVITTDMHGVIDYLNPVAEQLTGWSLERARGKPLSFVFNVIDAKTEQPLEDAVERCLREGRMVQLPETAALVNRDGRRFAVEESVAPIRDRQSNTVGAVLAFRDVTEERLLTQQISYQASHDPLTGLLNRREFEARLERALVSARTERLQHALCYFDLDQFKVVNDSCGHAAGDELLRQIAAQLQAKVRENDCVARLGGDEFGVLLEGCSLEKARHIADALRATIRDFRFMWEGRAYEVGASFGVVPVVESSGSLMQVLTSADSACYVAKDRGRNRIHVHQLDDGIVAQHAGEMQWVAQLREAMANNRLILHAQAIVPLSPTYEAPMREILLRMPNEHGELVLPGSFLPAAERYGLMPELDRWVTQTTLQMLAREPAHDVTSINLSGQSLGDAAFLEDLVDRIGRSGVEPRRLCFEINETAAIANLSRAMQFIARVRALGCRFALDDFGSGLSSFGYLKNLRVDYLKISGHFVRALVSDPIDAAMVNSINQIGHVIELRTIAESVENEAILQRVREIGVDFVQGTAVAAPKLFTPGRADVSEAPCSARPGG